MKGRIRMVNVQSVRSVRLLWILHFLVGFVVICLGVSSNGGGRKYVPVDPKAVSPTCHKAYVNVYAISQDDVDAVICCDGSHDKWAWLTGTYAGALCVPIPKLLPFARRLTKFPESWLLPLIPILLRIVTVQFRRLCNSNSAHGESESHHSMWVTVRRFISYIVLMNFRGWALYILFNMVQDTIASKFSATGGGGDSVATDGSSRTNDYPSGMDACWYEHLLHPSKQQQNIGHLGCYGRRFDFSDHVVLFFGHVLPVILFEVCFCFLMPFWSTSSRKSATGSTTELNRSSDAVSPSHTSSSTGTSRASTLSTVMSNVPTGAIPLFLLLSFVYLNILVFMAVHRTAAYFHTSTEIAVGYFISLLVQMPLGIILWGTQCLGRWDRARALVGLPFYVDSIRDD